VLDIAVTEDNARFASVGGDRQVFLWDVATGRTLRRWSGHGGRVNAVSFGGEGGSVVVSGEFLGGEGCGFGRGWEERGAWALEDEVEYEVKRGEDGEKTESGVVCRVYRF